jgi:putative phosphoesterase
VRIGVISDVHANLPALESVLAALEAERTDIVVHAGDVVGYGASPNECIELLRSRDVESVAGNHDLAVVGALDPSSYPWSARRVIDWTRTVLTEGNRRWLEELPVRRDLESVVVAHGSLDSAEDYVRTAEQADAQLARLEPSARLVLGHTHVALWHAGRLLNPGAVGQTRDGRILARYAILDESRAELREVPYDVARARAALRAAGLPPETFRWPPPLHARAVGRIQSFWR